MEERGPGCNHPGLSRAVKEDGKKEKAGENRSPRADLEGRQEVSKSSHHL